MAWRVEVVFTVWEALMIAFVVSTIAVTAYLLVRFVVRIGAATKWKPPTTLVRTHHRRPERSRHPKKPWKSGNERDASVHGSYGPEQPKSAPALKVGHTSRN